MLTPDQIQGLQVAFEHLSDPIIEYLIKDIARRVSEAGQCTSTASYQIWRAQNLGRSREQIKQDVSKLLGRQVDEIQYLFRQAAEVGYDFDIHRLSENAIPFAENATVQQVVDAAVKLAEKDMLNMTQTMGFKTPDGVVSPLLDAYQKTTDYAFTQVFTGAADYNTAIRRACAPLKAAGIRYIDYQSGVSTSLEAAIRRNMMGGLGLMVEQISQQTYTELEADGWEISAHANSAPDHEPIQGRQYSNQQYQALNNSLRRRIGTLNCGHSASPIVLGVSAPQYTRNELDRFRADNEKGVSVNGRHYTGYEATQQQRYIERSIRAQKRRVLVDESVKDQEKLTTDRIRLQRLNQEYRRFSKAAGLRTEPERVWVSGFSAKQRNAVRNSVVDEKQWRNLQSEIGKNAPKTLAEFTQIKYTETERWRQIMENNRLFKKIDNTATYSVEYKQKMKETYQYFLSNGFEFREHALNRVLGQKSGKEKFWFTREQLLDVLNRPHNYRQSDGKLVRFYNGIAAVSATDTGEIVSIIVRNTPRKDWDTI